MRRVRIHIGCPSGTTEDWSKSTEMLIPDELLDYFSAKIIELAEEKGRMCEYEKFTGMR